MTLTSFNYFFFLPIVFLLYWILFCKNKTTQNIFLLVVNCVFYSLWDWRFLALLLVTVSSTYYLGNSVHKFNGKKKTLLLIVGLFINLGILFYFKYYNFFIESLSHLLLLLKINVNFSTLNIILPIGISFYTFSALSYLIDNYQNKVTPSDDFLAYCTYVTFFPAILSGPISRAQKQLPQFSYKRVFTYQNGAEAFRMILWGAFLKLCVADRLGIYVDTVYGNFLKHNGTTLFLAQLLYTLQIYSDFAGYSLIAIGSGKLFGINLQENFKRPYFAQTVTEFWRKWHISLTTWFRDYIYFPLGGSRVKKTRWALNILIVFTISGLWHGAAFTFIAWGAIHGIVMIIERLIYGDKLKQLTERRSINSLFRVFLTFNLVSLIWIFFRIDTFNNAIHIIKAIFSDTGKPFIDIPTLLPAILSVGIMLSKDLSDEYNCRFRLLENKSIIIRFITYIIIICYILLCGVLDGNSFIYFQF